MKDIINNMISHPIKTAFVVGSVGVAISNIIIAVRGKSGVPAFKVVIGRKAHKENQEG